MDSAEPRKRRCDKFCGQFLPWTNTHDIINKSSPEDNCECWSQTHNERQTFPDDCPRAQSNREKKCIGRDNGNENCNAPQPRNWGDMKLSSLIRLVNKAKAERCIPDDRGQDEREK